MADSITGFIEVLDRVPTVLLSPDDAKVLNDARTSAEVLRSIDGSPVSVVLFGITGVGKSHLVNALTDMVVSEAGVLRPTTTAIVMAGRCGPASVAHGGEYVFAPSAPDRLVIVDTPAPATDQSAVAAAIAAAAVGVLVVTPSRYADAETNELWNDMEPIPLRMIVLNRQRGTESERAVVAESADQRFDGVSVVEVEEDGGVDELQKAIVANAAKVPVEHERVAIARSTACEAGRFVASSLTSASIGLGTLADAVERAQLPEISGEGLAVMESWRTTERELVALVRRSIGDLDRRITDAADRALAQRVADTLGEWDATGLEEGLEVWRTDTSDLYTSNATIRWRRSATERLVDRASWKSGVNAEVRVPNRVTRVMGSRFDAVTTESHTALLALLNQQVEGRRDLWRVAIEDIGSFMPGELLASVEALGY